MALECGMYGSTVPNPVSAKLPGVVISAVALDES